MSEMAPMPEAGVIDEAAHTFSMLASPPRLQLLWVLAQHERDVTQLTELVGGSGPSVSQHLAKLRLAGLVSARRMGKHQFYRVDDPHVVELVRQAVDHHEELRRRSSG